MPECWIVELSNSVGATFRCFDTHSDAMCCYAKLMGSSKYDVGTNQAGVWDLMSPPHVEEPRK